MAAHEFELIDWIARQQSTLAKSVVVGIGDDAAVHRQPDGSQILLATDLLMEGTHFLLTTATPEQIGHKALAVNLSDIAAMAGIPETALVSVALPRAAGETFARRMMTGLIETANQFDVALIGGDTNIWDGPLVINVAVTGRATARGPVLRQGARPGDQLFVTGPLGGSIKGRHLSFIPRVREALRLHEQVDLHAMLDLSDGLSSDVRHLLAENGTGVRLLESSLPIHPDVFSSSDDRTPLEHALCDGEDFELLFAVSPCDAILLAKQSEVAIHHIGETTDQPGVCELKLVSGQTIPIPDGGWKHRFG